MNACRFSVKNVERKEKNNCGYGDGMDLLLQSPVLVLA